MFIFLITSLFKLEDERFGAMILFISGGGGIIFEIGIGVLLLVELILDKIFLLFFVELILAKMSLVSFFSIEG